MPQQVVTCRMSIRLAPMEVLLLVAEGWLNTGSNGINSAGICHILDSLYHTFDGSSGRKSWPLNWLETLLFPSTNSSLVETKGWSRWSTPLSCVLCGVVDSGQAACISRTQTTNLPERYVGQRRDLT